VSNHEEARQALMQCDRAGIEADLEDVDASDPGVARERRFPGSPTIRVNGEDIEPGFKDPADYTPRCRLYATSSGLRGAPEQAWIVTAIRRSGPA
jgi:hypothetical protein